MLKVSKIIIFTCPACNKKYNSNGSKIDINGCTCGYNGEFQASFEDKNIELKIKNDPFKRLECFLENERTRTKLSGE